MPSWPDSAACRHQLQSGDIDPGFRAGSAIVRKLQAEGYSNLITRNRNELDLCNQAADAFFANEQLEYVLPALICKCHEALENKREKVTIWGTGSPCTGIESA